MTAIVSQTSPFEAVVASGQSASSPIPVGEFNGGTFHVPADMTGTTLTHQGSIDGVKWETVKGSDNNAVAALTFVEDSLYPLPAAVFQYKWHRFLSNGTEAAERTISVFLKG